MQADDQLFSISQSSDEDDGKHVKSKQQPTRQATASANAKNSRHDDVIARDHDVDDSDDEMELTTLHDERVTLVQLTPAERRLREQNVRDLPKVIFLQLVVLCFVALTFGLVLNVAYVDNTLFHITDDSHRAIVLLIFYTLSPVAAALLIPLVSQLRGKLLLFASTIGASLFIASKFFSVLPVLILGAICASLAAACFWTGCLHVVSQLAGDYALVRGMSPDRVYIVAICSLFGSYSLSPVLIALITSAVTTTPLQLMYALRTNCSEAFCWTEPSLTYNYTTNISDGTDADSRHLLGTEYEQQAILGIQLSLALASALFIAMTVEDSVLVLQLQRSSSSSDQRLDSSASESVRNYCKSFFSSFTLVCTNPIFILFLPLLLALGVNQGVIFRVILHSYTLCWGYATAYIPFLALFCAVTTLGHVMCAGLYAMLHVGFIIPLIVSGILQLTALILILTLAYTSSLALLITTIVFAGLADACMTAAVFGLCQKMSSGSAQYSVILSNIYSWKMTGLSLVHINVCSDVILVVYACLLPLAIIGYVICHIHSRLSETKNRQDMARGGSWVQYDERPGWLPRISLSRHDKISSL